MTGKLKKGLLPNLPYLLFAWLFDKLCQAVRLSPGADASEKLLRIAQGFTEAFASLWLSLHPLDLLLGVAGAALVRLAVYLKAKNAKKCRRGVEYGSARWGRPEDIAPYIDPVPDWNIPLTRTESLTMTSRPKDPKTARNKNILVIGGSGSGKTRFFVKPSLLQMHSSYVVTDPKGQLLRETGKLLAHGGPKRDENGKPVRDSRGKVIYDPYRIKVLNTINFSKSMKYNPLAYVRSEKDILKLVNVIIANTKGDGEKSSEDFWVKAERLLYCALIGYIWYEAEPEERNFITLLDLLNACEAREDDETYKSPVDILFDDLAKKQPEHFAVKQYVKFKMAAGVVCSKRLLNQAVGKSLRTHNLKPKKGAQVMRKNEKITALYERLSRDDFGKDDDQQRESNSISNQKAMLEEFAARQGFTNIVYFTDDGIIEELEVMQVPEHLQNYIDYEAYGRDVAMDEYGSFTDQGYVRDTGDRFCEYYDGERGSIPDEYRVMTFQDDLPEEEKSEWAMDIAFDMDEFFRQNDPQYAAEHPEAHAAKEAIYENLMAGRISALDEKLAALGQTQEDYLPSEIEKFKDATGYEEFLDFDPAEVKAALEDPNRSRVDEMLAAAEKAEREYAAEAAAYAQTPAAIVEQARAAQGEPVGSFSIYQLKSGNETLDYRFEPLDSIHRNGLSVKPENYELVYEAPLTEKDNLESIYTRFNVDRPADFTGHSLSVSDIVVLHQNGKDTAHYCDRVGFSEVPEFLQPTQKSREITERIQTPRGSFYLCGMTREQMEADGYGFHHASEDGKYLIMANGTQAYAVRADAPEKDNPLRTAEMTLEDDYGMIDGVINNGRRGEELEKAREHAERTRMERMRWWIQSAS